MFRNCVNHSTFSLWLVSFLWFVLSQNMELKTWPHSLSCCPQVMGCVRYLVGLVHFMPDTTFIDEPTLVVFE